MQLALVGVTAVAPAAIGHSDGPVARIEWSDNHEQITSFMTASEAAARAAATADLPGAAAAAALGLHPVSVASRAPRRGGGGGRGGAGRGGGGGGGGGGRGGGGRGGRSDRLVASVGAAAAGAAGGSGPLASVLPAAMRGVPLLRAHESPERLCSAKPPYGLLGDPSQLGGNTPTFRANFSRLRGAARSRSHVALCESYAARLDSRAAASRGPPPFRLPRGASCAVVGSSGTLLSSGLGSEIDAHTAVLRMNLAPAGGKWAADAGARTTLRIYTDKSYQRSPGMDLVGGPPTIGGGGGGGNRTRSQSTGLLYCMAQGWVGKCMHAPGLWHVNPVFVRHLRAHLDEHRGRGRLPSAGLLSVAMSLTQCETVSIYGFGNASDAASAGACGHYWDCGRAQSKYFGGKSGYHDWQAQWRLLSAWIERARLLLPGKLRFVTRG